MATVYRSNDHNGTWFSDDGTWVTTDGGTTHANHPVAGDTVYLTSNSGNITVDNTGAACAVLDCTGFTGSFTFLAGTDITTTGNVTLVGPMSFASSTSTWTFSGGTVIPAGKSLYDVNINNTTVTLSTSDLTISHNLTLTGSSAILTGRTVTMTGGTWSHTSTGQLRSSLTFNGNCTVSGNVYYRTGTLTHTSGTITVTSSTLNIGAGTTLNTSTMSWNDIVLSGHNWLLELSSNLDINGNLTYNMSATGVGITVGTNDITLAGSLTLGGDGTSYIGLIGTRTITFDGTGTIERTVNSAGYYPYCTLNMVFNTTGTITFGTSNIWYHGGTDYSTSGNITYTAGTIITTGATIYIYGACSLDTSAMSWNHVGFRSGGSGSLTYTLTSDLDINGDLITPVMGGASYGAIITGAGRTITVAGNLNIGRILSGVAAIVMDGSGTWSASGAYTINKNITFNTAGTIVVSGNVYFGGSNTPTLAYTAGTMTLTSSTLNIAGSCTFTDATNTWVNIKCTSSSTLTLSQTTTISGTLSANGGVALTLAGNNMSVQGSLTTDTSGASIRGQTITLSGTGTWSSGGGADYYSSNIVINTAGTITIGSTLGIRSNTVTYTAGTIVTNNTNTVVGDSVTLTGIPDNMFKNLIGGYNSATITLTNPLVVSGALKPDTVNWTFATSDITCVGIQELNAGSISGAGRTITLTGGTWSWGGSSSYWVSTNVVLAGNITISGTIYYRDGTLTYSSGTITTTGSTLVLRDGNTTLNTNGVTWNNITFNNARTYTLSSALQVANITMGTNSVLACGVNAVTITGNLTNNNGSASTWRTGNNTFIFNGTTTIAGASNFYNFTINPGKTVNLTSTQVFAVAGTFNAAGTIGSPITFKAVTGSSAAHFDVTTVGTVTYVNATDIDSAGGSAITTTNGSITRTVNWTLLIPSTGNSIFFGVDF